MTTCAACGIVSDKHLPIQMTRTRLPLSGGPVDVAVCADPVACRMRAQLEGKYCAYPAAVGGGR